MKRDTVDDACHGKLCNSSLKETAGEILFAENSSGNPFISVVLKSIDKTTMYSEMTDLLSEIP